MNLLRSTLRALVRTVRDTKRLKEIFKRNKWRENLFIDSIGETWKVADTGFLVRSYKSYEQYLEHQKHKLSQIDLGSYDTNFRTVLFKRLQQRTEINFGKAIVLCLGARIGTEVKAFMDLGSFAVGIDLNPGKDNRFVLHGDFHNIQFPDQSVDIVFTNSLDHAYELEKLLEEVRRVLREDGLLITEIPVGSAYGFEKKFYESLWWDKWERLVAYIRRRGFNLVSIDDFDRPWNGKQVIFAKTCQKIDNDLGQEEFWEKKVGG